MKHFYWFFNNCLSEEEIDRLKNEYSGFTKRAGTQTLDKEMSDKWRKSKIAWVSEDNFVYERVLDLFYQANHRAFNFNVDYVNGISNIQYTEYDESYKGEYTTHIDSFLYDSNTFYDRKLTITIQLTDPKDYEGGEFWIQDPLSQDWIQPPEFKEKGSAIVFPSFLRHKVTPVTKGKRTSLVAWLEGEYFR